MGALFAETLKRLRSEKGLSQKELSERLFVSRSAVSLWESGKRLPDTAMLRRISACLGVDIYTLLNAAGESAESPNVIMVDDRELILSCGLPILEEVIPGAVITGFTSPREAVRYSEKNRVSLAFVDIELGKTSGLELCRTLLDINPRTNVVYLTAYAAYSLDAWSTGASGFMLKPITADGVREQLKMLRYPFSPGGEAV